MTSSVHVARYLYAERHQCAQVGVALSIAELNADLARLQDFLLKRGWMNMWLSIILIDSLV